MDVNREPAESRRERTLRLGRISWRVLCADRRLLAFPALSVLLNFGVGAGAYVLVAEWIGVHHRLALVLATVIISYPLTFFTTLFGVALAATLAARLDGDPAANMATGWAAARNRLGTIALWTLLVCTVGAIFTFLRERLPLGGRIAAWIGGIAWSLATVFALPVLAYEDLGPIATLKRSSALFRARWTEQTTGIIGIGVVAWFVALPFGVLLVAGLLVHGAAGVVLFASGGAGLIAIGALDTAVNQVFRLFLYRNVVGLDADGSGPFTADDLTLDPLWAASRRERWNLAPTYRPRADGLRRNTSRHYFERR